MITRPVDALIAAPLGLYVLVSYRREIWMFMATAIPPLLFQLWYNAAYFGTPFRIQFLTQSASAGGQRVPSAGFWATPVCGELVILGKSVIRHTHPNYRALGGSPPIEP